jgi:hypothetical protein
VKTSTADRENNRKRARRRKKEKDETEKAMLVGSIIDATEANVTECDLRVLIKWEIRSSFQLT